MEIKKITKNKKQYLDLLLLADEQENMIDKYLEPGDMYILIDKDVKSSCVVLRLDEETVEIKSLATYEKYQGMGYGTKMINFVFENYKSKAKRVLVGTGDSDGIIHYYQNRGFSLSHRLNNFLWTIMMSQCLKTENS
jgi:GNAT superfamily N-acetyltransferase